MNVRMGTGCCVSEPTEGAGRLNLCTTTSADFRSYELLI